MNYLETLTPAENLLLREKGGAGMRGLLKSTLVDLLLKEVLVLYKETNRVSNRNDRPRHLSYVKRGPEYRRYRPLPHEQVFRAPFHSSDTRHLLRNLVSIAREKAASLPTYRAMITDSPRTRALWKRGILNRILGNARLNEAGLAAHNALMRELTAAEHSIVPELNARGASAQRLLARLHGNVSLLEGLDPSLLPDVDGEGFGPRKPSGTDTGCGSACGSGCGASACGGHGCGGSGCGGSGCGGCGGCS